MSRALRTVGAWLLAALGGVTEGVVTNSREVGVLLSLGLITVGLWADLGARALIVSGLVGLWIWLPPRIAFVLRPGQPDVRRKRS